ncbi:hypothetical protein J6590_047254 [Homalodisca vitripennis]|nr:hypothetical protein J6590_047254 [Homalodisca vitripennis]
MLDVTRTQSARPGKGTAIIANLQLKSGHCDDCGVVDTCRDCRRVARPRRGGSDDDLDQSCNGTFSRGPGRRDQPGSDPVCIA